MRYATATLLAFMLAGTGTATSANSEHQSQAVPAQRAAAALATASAAYDRGNRKALYRALVTLEGMGVHAMDGTEADPMPRWRQRARLTRSVWRGRPLGPGFRSGKLAPGAGDNFSQLFLSGEGATIAVSSPTGNRVAMKVADAKAQTVCSGETGRDGTCRWVPLFTQRYTIQLSNPGAKDAQYFLVVN